MIPRHQMMKPLRLTRTGRIVNGLILLILLAHSIYRDILLERQFPTDLRNRVIGARLQKDGKLPYHYHWQSGDGLRYYNPDENTWLPAGRIPNDKKSLDSDINKITASPFFHELLIPVCDLPQRTLSQCWLFAQYLMLAFMIIMISKLSDDPGQKWLILNMGILFTLTEAWKSSISTGQLYFFLSFLMSCILIGLVRNKKYGLITAGICMTILVLCRPLAIVIFIPILIQYKKYLLFLGTSLGLLLIYLLFIFISPGEKALYKDYVDAMRMQVKLHQAATGTVPLHTADLVIYTEVEGFDLNEVHRLTTEYPIPIYSENGNVFVLYYKLFHKKISPALLYSSLALTLGFLLLFYLRRKKNDPAQTLEMILFGCTLFMIVELFSPVFRRQYNTTEWFALVLAAILLLREGKNIISLLLISGLILNILNVGWLPWRHTLGEYAWLFALTLLILMPTAKTNLKKGSPPMQG